MLKLPKELRDTLLKYLDNSPLPHTDVKQFIQAFTSLEVIEETKSDKK